MIYLIIDTNVCLHFISIDEYPWNVQLKEDKEIILVITHPLIEELDKKKYSGKNHLKDRATKVLRMIEKSEGQILKNKCRLYLFDKNVNKDYVDSLGLDNADGDDRMLASAVKFKELVSGDILLVTNDLGPRLKARKFEIKCLTPDSNYELKSPEDELEKAIKNLKKENEQLKNMIPKLSIKFKNGNKLEKYKLVEISESREDFIDDEMLMIKNKYPTYAIDTEESSYEKKSPHSNFIDIRSLMGISNNLGISKEGKEEYNSKLKEFFRDYEYYLELLFDYKIQSALTLEVLFELNNEGTSPADDIDIYFHFPDGFELFDEESYPKEPNPPDPPEKPRSLFEPLYPPPLFYNRITNTGMPHVFPNSNVSSPVIKKTNSYEVEIHVKKLKHNQTAPLDKMLVVFSDYESIINFAVDYELKCSNVPNAVTGTLNFIVEKLTNL